jgi:ribonucleotide monophosphatase NagD (HAD superfamily)
MMFSRFTPTRLYSRARSVSTLLKNYDSFLFDCDGVLWNSNTAIAGSAEAVAQLRSAGKRVIFLTNNAAKSRQHYTKKLDKLGFGNIDVLDINTSASAGNQDTHKFNHSST